MKIESFWDRAFHAWDHEGLSEAQILLGLLEEIRLHPDSSSTSEWLCLRAYVHYALGDRPRALATFREALVMGPGDGFAALYIGHCLFDVGEVKEALAAFTKINRGDLTEALDSKRIEMVLCCRVILNGIETVRDQIQVHLEACSNLDDFPVNLERVLVQERGSIAEWSVPGMKEFSHFGMRMERAKTLYSEDRIERAQ